MKLRRAVGFAGIAKDENFTAKQWGRRFDFMIVAVAVWLVIQYYLEYKQHLRGDILHVFDWLIWGFFVLETGTLVILTDKKWRYLKQNWINLVIILGSFPLLWLYTPYIAVLRAVRLILILRLMLPMWDASLKILSMNRLGTTLLVALIVTLLSGVLISTFDPAFHSAWDGIWYVWETVTTVGYGDIIPTTFGGKLFGALLILMGVGLISLFTANFSAYFVGQRAEELEQERIERQKYIAETVREIRFSLDELNQRLSRLEEDKTKNQEDSES